MGTFVGLLVAGGFKVEIRFLEGVGFAPQKRVVEGCVLGVFLWVHWFELNLLIVRLL